MEPTRGFFARLAEQRHPALGGISGAVRFDIDDGERTEHWHLQIRRGDITVSHEGPEADCVISADIATFDAILAGRMNAMAAILRGAVTIEGKVVLLAALQRLFPGTSEAPDTPQAGYARRSS